MRWVFLLLLLLNGAMFFWYNRPQAQLPAELRLSREGATSMAQKSLRLLNEAESHAAAGSSSAEGVEESNCLLLGGFDKVERARQLEQRLLSLDISARVITVEASRGEDHWVYIPPLASPQAAMRQLQELQAHKIAAYLITEGDLANGILLGVFPQRAAADSVADKVRSAGYEPQLHELPRIYQEFWVRVARNSQRLVGDELIAGLTRDFSDLKHQVISCSGLARE